jgi:hypothetical protein
MTSRNSQLKPTADLNAGNVSPTLSVHGINRGDFGAKGKARVLNDVTVTVDLRDEKVSHWPLGSPDRRSRFEPQRVTLETSGAIYSSHTSWDARCGPT